MVQVWCLAGPARPAVLEVVGLGCVFAATVRRRRRLQHRAVTFDASAETFETLGLSPALD
jgi:hypothetical protein